MLAALIPQVSPRPADQIFSRYLGRVLFTIIWAVHRLMKLASSLCAATWAGFRYVNLVFGSSWSKTQIVFEYVHDSVLSCQITRNSPVANQTTDLRCYLWLAELGWLHRTRAKLGFTKNICDLRDGLRSMLCCGNRVWWTILDAVDLISFETMRNL